ncbi:MAG: hypothetical protein NVS1B6_00940 [Steroidobacteraceae bacterium]
MNYLSTETFESKLPAFTGVRYELRRWSTARRAQYNRAMAEALSRLREANDEYEQLQAQQAEATARAKIEPCQCKHPPAPDPSHDAETGRCLTSGCVCRKPDTPITDTNRMTDLLVTMLRIKFEDLQPTAIRWGLVQITGLDIDGQPATPESLLADGPDDLATEIADALDLLLRLSPEQQKNSESPTTSGAPVDGATKTSGAPDASRESSTAGAAA